jgi:hypothetical protein
MSRKGYSKGTALMDFDNVVYEIMEEAIQKAKSDKFGDIYDVFMEIVEKRYTYTPIAKVSMWGLKTTGDIKRLIEQTRQLQKSA